MDRKIMVKSETSGRKVISLPELQLKVVWEKKGVIRPIPFEKLEQAMYNNGVEYMFKQGMLSIEDKQAKIDLGLETEDTDEVKGEKIVILTDNERKRYLTILPMVEFREKIKELPYEQINSLVDYAIENEITNLDKSEFLKEITGIDIFKAIQLNRQAKED